MFNYEPTYHGSNALDFANRISPDTVNKKFTPLQKMVINNTPDDFLKHLMSKDEKQKFEIYCKTMNNINNFNEKVKVTPENEKFYNLHCNNNGGKRKKKTKKRRYKKKHRKTNRV